MSADYSQEEYFSDVDSGWEPRNNKVLSLLNLVTVLPGLKLNRKARVLDYGSGRGLLVEMLRNNGYDAYGYEPFATVHQGVMHTFKTLKEVSTQDKTFDIVTLIEVLEHIKEARTVLTEISRTLKRDGYLFISTGIYDKNRHGRDWFYLFPEAGHVSVFSATSLEYLLSSTGFRKVLRLNETMWIFRSTSREISLLDSLYFWLTNLRVALKPTNLTRLVTRLSNDRDRDA